MAKKCKFRRTSDSESAIIKSFFGASTEKRRNAKRFRKFSQGRRLAHWTNPKHHKGSHRNMLSALVAGYTSSEESDEDEGKHQDADEDKEKSTAQTKPAETKPVQPPKRKLPSAAAMMASTTSWAKGTEEPAAQQGIDQAGTKYHHVQPPSKQDARSFGQMPFFELKLDKSPSFLAMFIMFIAWAALQTHSSSLSMLKPRIAQ